MKELSQIKLVLPFKGIPKSNIIGLQRILRELEETVAMAIMHDILGIVTEGLREIELRSFIETLQQLHQAIQNLPISATKSKLSQLLRFLVLVVENRLEQVKPPDEVRIQCEQISSIIGRVPLLNTAVQLPDPRFLPSQYQRSIQSWEKIIWRNPSRESKEEKLEFFTRLEAGHRIASVRLHLIDLDKDPNTIEALSYAEVDFFDVGNLQADHLQPSEHIVKRQMELVAAMNLDPLFEAKELHEAEGRGYFKKQGAEVFGTKKFYLEYHNCIDNLWFISTVAGARKSNQDPIEWLDQHVRFGAAFFDSLGGKESINCHGILYTTQEGVLLAKAARTWFQTQYGEEITAAGYILHQIKKPLFMQVKQAQEKSVSKREKVKLMAKLATAAELVESGAPSDESEDVDRSSSLGSSDTEITEKNLERMKDSLKPEMPIIKKGMRDGLESYKAEAKHRKKEEETKKSSQTTSDDAGLSLRSSSTRGGK